MFVLSHLVPAWDKQINFFLPSFGMWRPQITEDYIDGVSRVCIQAIACLLFDLLEVLFYLSDMGPMGPRPGPQWMGASHSTHHVTS